MTPTRSGCGAFVAVLVTALLGCRAPGAADPFRTPRDGPAGPDVTTVSVRFQVSCDTCFVRWSVGERTDGFRERALWSGRRDVRLRPGETVDVTLSAAPDGSAGPVEYVRIYVGGDLAVEARRDDPRGTPDPDRSSLSVAVTLPLPGEGGGS